MRRGSQHEVPGVLAVSFWIGWAMTTALAPFDPLVPVGPFVAVQVALCGLWAVLPWQRVRGTRALAPVGFALTVLSLSFIGPSATFLPMMVTALANLVFSLGLPVAVTVAVAELAVLGLVLQVQGQGGPALVPDIVSVGVLMAFALTMAFAVLEARARRSEAESLLVQVEALTVAEERARFAHDMHDSLGHSLTVVKLALEGACRLRAGGSDEEGWREVRHATDLTAQALVDTRRWVRALKPMALAGNLGEDALRDLAATFRGAGIRIEYRVGGDVSALSPLLSVVLYRVLQESLTNTVRHSQATRVDIALTVDGAGAALSVVDDGAGSAADPMHGGFGLAALAERVEAVGGRLQASNGPGGGFRVEAVLPSAPRDLGLRRGPATPPRAVGAPDLDRPAGPGDGGPR